MDPNIIVEVQTPPILTWAFGVMALSMVGIAGTLVNLARRMTRVESSLESVRVLEGAVKTMHEHPDDYGFGTKKTNEMLQGLAGACRSNCQQSERVARSIDRLAHYLRHFIETQSGRKIPPPPPPIGGNSK